MNTEKNGFTLIESLIVLAIFSILLLIAVPLSLNFLENREEHEFLRNLEMDLLFIQSQAMSTGDFVRIEMQKDQYLIHEGDTVSKVRELPKGFSIDTRVYGKDISFNMKGSVRKSGTIAIHTRNNRYNMILPLGKGRARFEKQ